MIDLPHAETVEISIAAAHNGARVWIHVDGRLQCRVYRIADLTLDDRRSRTKALEAAARHVLQRCNDNGGTIDGDLVAEIEAALGEVDR